MTAWLLIVVFYGAGFGNDERIVTQRLQTEQECKVAAKAVSKAGRVKRWSCAAL